MEASGCVSFSLYISGWMAQASSRCDKKTEWIEIMGLTTRLGIQEEKKTFVKETGVMV